MNVTAGPTTVSDATPTKEAVSPELQREREIVQQENVVFEDAYQQGIITEEQRDKALGLQKKRVSDTKGVPVTAQPSPLTTAYLKSDEPFLQKDVGAVILPKQGIVYKGELYQVDVPKNMVITGVKEGEPIVEKTATPEGEMVTTSTPLTLSFAMDPSYTPPPVPTEPLISVPSSLEEAIRRAFSPNDPLTVANKLISQESRALQYSKETGIPLETAREMVIQADLQQTLLKAAIVGGAVSIVAAPTVALIGAGTSLAVSQGVKAVTEGKLLTAEEAVYAGGSGAVFGVVGSAVTGAATSKIPVLAEQTLKGAAARVTFSTALGVAGGAGISATETAFMGGTPEQIVEAAGRGAVVGGAVGATFATGVEVYNVAKPWLARRYEGVKAAISPEASMYNRVVVQAQEGESVVAERGLSWGDRLRGILNPEEAATYQKVVPQTETKGASMLQRIGDYLRPETAMYRRVTGTSPTEPTVKPTSSPDTYYSSGKFVPFEGGKGGLSSVLVVKQKPAVSKTTVKPFPVQTAAWTLGVKAIEPQTVKVEQKVVADLKKATVEKTVSAKKQKTESTLAGTAEIVGVNPMLYQGPEFPSIRRRGRKRVESETIVLDYPKGGLEHPEKMGEVLNISKIEDVGREQQQVGTLTKTAVKDLVAQKDMVSSLSDTVLSTTPSSLVGVEGVPLVDTSSMMKTTQAQEYKTEQRIVEDLTEGLQQKKTSRLQRGSFEINLPEGFGSSRRTWGGVGFQKRKYPIVTGEDILKAHLKVKKSTKKAKSRGGNKSVRRKNK